MITDKHFQKAITFGLFLLTLSLVSCHPSDENLAQKDFIRAGVYNGSGASPVCVLETMEALRIDNDILPCEVSPVAIQNGKLDSLDVLIFPGGSGSKEYNSLGQKGGRLVKEFLQEKGKGIVGICAGGYLTATTPGYPSLKILDASTIREHYDRGRGLVAFTVTDDDKPVFPELMAGDTFYVQYYDGPIYELADSANLEVVGTFISDIATHASDPHGVTPGKPAFLHAPFGNGKIFVSVGHPESTPGMRWMVPRMARWVANAPLVPYPESVVRPQINSKEVLYFPEVIRKEKKLFWTLFSNDDNRVVQALDTLHKLRSRPSVRWSIGLLRHGSEKVRLKAAGYLLESEYTYAISDLEMACRQEQNNNLKRNLEQILEQLQAIRVR